MDSPPVFSAYLRSFAYLCAKRFRIHHQGRTSTSLEARMTPASGPESNSAVILRVPYGCDWGTRTEAAQKVPQAKPECAVASSCSLRPPRSEIWAPSVSCRAGDTGVPRYATLIKRPSPV